MKNTLLLVCLFLCTKLFAQSGDVHGKLLSQKTSKPISFTSVSLSSLNKITQTDINGNFIFKNISEGKYKLLVSPLGHSMKEFDIIVKADSGISLVIQYPDTCIYDVHRKSRNCPICNKKNQVVPIIYGMPIGKLDEENYYFAGCEKTDCNPTWYCKRDKKSF